MIRPITPAMITSRTIQRNSAMTIAESSTVRARRRNSGRVRSATRLFRRRSTRRRSFADSPSLAGSRSGMDRLLEVGDQVLGVLDADAQSDEAVGDAGLRALVRGQVRVRCVTRLGDERVHAAEARRVLPELQPPECALDAACAA